MSNFIEYFAGKRVAIIGNAPYEEKLGDKINSCDIVVRFNRFYTTGYEDRIGTKFNLWAFRNHFVFPGNAPDVTTWEECVLDAEKRLAQCNAVYWALNKGYRKYKRAIQIHNMLKSKTIKLREHVPPKQPTNHLWSTGLMFVNVAVAMPYKSLLIAGFTHFDPSQRRHMQNDGLPRVHGHDTTHEEKVFNDLTLNRRNLEIIKHKPLQEKSE